MPKFLDQWVVDRTLFEYVSGGSCACCGRGFFLPDGVEGMIRGISDLETDAANAEIKAAEQSPWPSEMREQVWSDRVRLRYKLKQEMVKYAKFWLEQKPSFESWMFSMEPTKLKMLFQMPRSEVLDCVTSHYGIHSAFVAVLTSVVEQVVHFGDTKYPTDGRGDSEINFEKALIYDRRGGFTLAIVDREGNRNERIIRIWLDRMSTLGGPTLLERTPKGVTDSGGADDAEDQKENSPKPSFRMDRRVIRLLIARLWADKLLDMYTDEVLLQ
jgi:hypothetical protein